MKVNNIFAMDAGETSQLKLQVSEASLGAAGKLSEFHSGGARSKAIRTMDVLISTCCHTIVTYS